MTTVNHHGVSDQGRVRFKNEDFIISRYPDDLELLARKGSLFIVADGVGGHGAGDVASSEAGREFVISYYASPWKPDRALKAAFSHTNLHVFDIGVKTNRSHMQTTFSALAICGSRLHIIHIGDTRIYRVRGSNRIEQLTQDHSEVAELVRMNILSPEKARTHPRRSIITRSLGSQPVAQPMYKTDTVVEGDIFVMCTDGIWEPVPDSEIAEIVVTYSPDEACAKLVERGLAGQSTDNLSVQVIRVITVAEDSLPEGADSLVWWRKIIQRLKPKRKSTEEATGRSLCS